jgi:hypothetical protein
MDNRLVIGRVHIVEWLNTGDDDTGRKLFDELQQIGAVSEPKVEVDFHRIDTAGHLLGLLMAFTEQYRTEKRTPILHLETHGNQDGIGAGGQSVAWRDLAEVLVPLNRLTGLNLVVVLAACWGFYGTSMLRPSFGPAPFRGLIGPNQKLSEEEVLKACLAFYRTVFVQRDGDAALKTMNESISASAEMFWNVSAELAFKLAFGSYLKGEGSPDGAGARADAFAARRAIRIEKQTGSPVSITEIAEWRERVRGFLLNHPARFDLEWRKVFYIDEFPENAVRFDFTVEDCTPAGT